METFTCIDCSQDKEVPSEGGGTGYATTDNKEKVCYACCGERDKKYMEENKNIDLYLSGMSNVVKTNLPQDKVEVINWPGTLRFRVQNVRKGSHNIARQRTDVWFTDHKGNKWWGRNTGDNDIVRCRKVKG